MYPQTSGKAWIEGQEIGYPSTNQLIGVCPQFDILWSELTVEEHLRFYCKLKQISKDEIDNRVKDLLQEVDLTT
jgi:ABC-type multidrug transport system ATPase subunit